METKITRITLQTCPSQHHLILTDIINFTTHISLRFMALIQDGPTSIRGRNTTHSVQQNQQTVLTSRLTFYDHFISVLRSFSYL